MTTLFNMPTAGELNCRVTIQQPKTVESAENDYGEIDTTVDEGWQHLGSRPAQILTEGSREVFRSRQFQPDTTHIVRLRYDKLTKRLQPEMRLVHNERSLEIIGAHNMNELNQFVEATCREKK
jgi:SPP1 family predicted phage head-tail adaptor